MANNSFLIKRVAFGNFTFPFNNSDNTASTLSALVNGAYIPKGALVSGITLFPAGALTDISGAKNGTINFAVGGQVLGTNNRIMSQAIVQTAAHTLAASSAGLYVSVGGPLIVQIASSDNARVGIAYDCDVYVEYLYCSDRDVA